MYGVGADTKVNTLSAQYSSFKISNPYSPLKILFDLKRFFLDFFCSVLLSPLILNNGLREKYPCPRDLKGTWRTIRSEIESEHAQQCVPS